jgi:hypothetical protein
MGEIIMITQIGIASGDILNLIDEKKRPVSFSEVEAHLDNEKELTYMSIGWLVREGHVHLVDKGKDKYLCNC